MIRVKVCGMTDPVNAREALAAGADFLGFIFYPGSKRYVGGDPDRLFRDIPADALKVGVFVDEDMRKLVGCARKYGLSAVQLHGSETPDYCRSLRREGILVIRAFGLSADFDFSIPAGFADHCDYFLFDSQSTMHGGSGLKFPWQVLERYTLETPFFLSGGIGPDDAKAIGELTLRSLFAADINSRFEVSPGIKDIRLVEDFIRKLR